MATSNKTYGILNNPIKSNLSYLLNKLKNRVADNNASVNEQNDKVDEYGSPVQPNVLGPDGYTGANSPNLGTSDPWYGGEQKEFGPEEDDRGGFLKKLFKNMKLQSAGEGFEKVGVDQPVSQQYDASKYTTTDMKGVDNQVPDTDVTGIVKSISEGDVNTSVEDYNKRFETKPNVNTEDAVITDKQGDSSKKESTQDKRQFLPNKGKGLAKALGYGALAYGAHKNKDFLKGIPFDKQTFLQTLISQAQNKEPKGKEDVTDIVKSISGVDDVVNEATGNTETTNIAGVDDPLGEEGYASPDYSNVYGDSPEYEEEEDITIGGQGSPIDPVKQGMLGFSRYGKDFQW